MYENIKKIISTRSYGIVSKPQKPKELPTSS